MKKILAPLAVVALFLFAAAVLERELHHYRFHDVERAVRELPASRLALAFVFTVLNYVVLTAYDVLALRYVGRPLAYAKTAVASFTAYVFSYNVGLSVLGGASIRFRLYSAWGLSGVEIAKVVAFCGLTMWLGFFTISGVVFLVEPLQVPVSLRLPPGAVRALGAALIVAVTAFLAWTARRRTPVKIRNWEFSLPTSGVARPDRRFRH